MISIDDAGTLSVDTVLGLFWHCTRSFMISIDDAGTPQPLHYFALPTATLCTVSSRSPAVWGLPVLGTAVCLCVCVVCVSCVCLQKNTAKLLGLFCTYSRSLLTVSAQEYSKADCLPK
jgi:hypothetical protein